MFPDSTRCTAVSLCSAQFAGGLRVSHSLEAKEQNESRTKMDISSLASKFLESSHGQGAAAALSAQGFGADDVQQVLNHSISAGAAHVEQAHQDSGGMLGKHAGMSFFAAFASGLVKGDGVFGSLEDGAAGMIQGRIVGLLTAHMGMDSAAASAAAAATAPYVLAFLREHLRL